MFASHFKLTALPLTVLAALSACGGGGDDTPAAEASAERAAALAVGSGGALTLASASAGGQAADGRVCAVSGNGNKVLFTSRASTLVGGDTNGATDIFLKDLNGNGVTRVVAASGFTQRLVCLAMTPDANSVVYADSNVQPAPALLVKNLATGAVTQATPPTASLPNVRGYLFAGISDDGQRIAFIAQPTITYLGGYNAVVNGPARMLMADLPSGQVTSLESQVRLATLPYGEPNGDAQLSPDGRHLAFTTPMPYPEAGDTTNTSDVYALDIAAGTVRLVSTDVSGQSITILGGVKPGLGVQGFLAGGTRIAFRYPNDTSAGPAGIFVKDLATGALSRVLNDNLASVRGFRAQLSFSDDGRKVAYVERNGNSATGVYVARVRDVSSGTLLNAATVPNGTVGNGRTSNNSLLSRDGMVVAFDNDATNLAPGTSTPAVLRAYRKLLID